MTVYRYRHVENPKRSFLTAQHDTYQMQNNSIVEHDISSTSQVKGFFDLITQPTRSALGTKS